MSFLLVASILPLVLGPLLVRLLKPARWASAGLDAFVVVSIGGLALLHILPECFEEGGWAAVAGALLGLLVPGWAERLLEHDVHSSRWRTLLIGFALLALMAHGILDGVALQGAQQASMLSQMLAAAVIVHRFPVGVGVWWFVRPKLGLRLALLTLAIEVGGTLVGFFGGHSVVHGTTGPVLAVFQAMVAGSLLHVMLGHSHETRPAPRSQQWQVASALGGLAAVGLLVAMAQIHVHGEATDERLDIYPVFLSLALKSAPPLLLAYVGAALARAVLPHGAIHRGRSQHLLAQALRGVGLGMPSTICSCSVIPTHQRTIAQAAPPAAAVSFLISSSTLGLSAILLSYTLLGPGVALSRIVAVLVLALLAGLVTGLLVARSPVRRALRLPQAAAPATTLRSRLIAGFRFSFGETVDHTMPWFLVGLGAAAFLQPFIRPEWLAQAPAGLDVPILALLGVPMYVCASGATPLGAMLMLKGVSAGAVVAFLLTGPATTIALFGVPTSVYGKRTAWMLSGFMVLLAVGLGTAVNLVLPAGQALQVQQALEAPPSWLEQGCLGVLAAVLLVSLFRQGVRGFVQRIVLTHAAASTGEHKGHGHGHEPHSHKSKAHGKLLAPVKRSEDGSGLIRMSE